MRRFTTEDRSLSGPNKPCKKTRKENLTLQDMEHITDFTAEEFDALADMILGQKRILDGWLYIQRTE